MTTNQGAAEGMRRELQSGFAGELIAPQDADTTRRARSTTR
jgi:hypothetical protein